MHKVYLCYSRHPQTCLHIINAWKAGYPHILTYAPYSAKKNRKTSLKNHPRISGYDRDEYPFACTEEGGADADIEYILPSDNRSAGASIGAQFKKLRIQPGEKFEVIIKFWS